MSAKPRLPRRCAQRMRRSRFTAPDCPPLDVRGHHVLCAVCARGGCKTPPPGRRVIDRMLRWMWRYPYAPLRITADIDVNRAHYLDVYEDRGARPLPRNFDKRRRDYVWRRRDLEVCRLLDIAPNTVLPAFEVYRILFARVKTLEGICTSRVARSRDWPECPHAKKGYYARIAGAPRAGLAEQTEQGEALDGRGLWAMVRPRTREDMARAKRRSAEAIRNADRLYIRGNHLLCILCTAHVDEPLIQDNLIELRRRMEEDPDIPVTLTEGCCMVCDPCNVYHPGEHLCYHAHFRNQLRDLHTMERLGLPPGATLPARELYARVYDRVGDLREICAWNDDTPTTTHLWKACGGAQDPERRYESARAARRIAGGRSPERKTTATREGT